MAYRTLAEYVIAGPDGRRYYDIIGIPLHLIELYEGLVSAYRIASANPLMRIQAVQIGQLQREIQTRMDAIALRTSAIATAAVESNIDNTRKRSTSVQSASQSGRLRGGIVSRPLAVLLSKGSGAVGVGDIERLEQATRSGVRRHRPAYPFYWRAQEDGSSAAVGKVFIGLFQPGNVKPSRTMFRSEATLTMTSKGGLGTISKAVEARNFLKDGANEARLFRHRSSKAVDVYASDRMAIIARERPAPFRGGSQASVRRAFP